MIKTIKGAMRSPRYKAQKLFVITDMGVSFKYRFCVIGLPAEMYKLTKYFEKEAEACAYFELVFEQNKDFSENINRGFESANYKARAHGAKRMHQIYKKKRAMRRDCSFKPRKKQ